MTIQVLGISGSPIANSNTDRAVQSVMKQTGLRTGFVKLSNLRMEPCRACLGCKENNRCVVEDDLRELAEVFRHATAFVIGCYTPYGSLDARTKTFMERMYCLHHQEGLNRGKLAASVITSAMPTHTPGLPPAAQTAATQLDYWMTEEGMTNLGGIVLLGDVPCIKCGHGDDCPISGVRLIQGPQATVATVGSHPFDADAALLDAARQLAQTLRQAVLQREAEMASATAAH